MAQQQRQPLLGRQATNGCSQRRLSFFAFQFARRVSLGSCRNRQFGKEQKLIPLHGIAAEIAKDGEELGFEGGDFRFELMRAAIDLQKRFLGEVFGFCLLTSEAPGQSEG